MVIRAVTVLPLSVVDTLLPFTYQPSKFTDSAFSVALYDSTELLTLAVTFDVLLKENVPIRMLDSIDTSTLPPE